MKRRDVNEVAFATLQQAVGVIPKEDEVRKAEAAEQGRAGGRKGGAARNATLSRERKREIATKAARARWDKIKGGK